MPTLKMKLPNYAKDMLWMTSGEDFQAQVPENLQVRLENLTTGLTLRWGTPNGSPLRHWTTVSKDIVWNGHVRVGGHVECLHVLSFDEADLLIVEIRGSLLPMNNPRLPSLADLKQAPFERNVFTDFEEGWYAFITETDSPFADFLHHSLVNGQSLDCYGVLADEASGFHQIVGMPMLLESVTLYAA